MALPQSLKVLFHLTWQQLALERAVLLKCADKPGEAEITPQGATAVAGRPFVLTCGARPPGWPRPEYRWWREGQEHNDLGHRANHSFLQVHSSHEGRYFCQPHNALGKGSIASVYLAVNGEQLTD